MNTKNHKLYMSAVGLLNLARVIKTFDEEFSQVLLNKAQDYKNQIILDENLEKEVDDYVKKIEERL